MRNIAIVEDEENEAAALAGFIQRYGEKTGEQFNIFTFLSAEKFLSGYSADYSIVFMDIELPGMNGMDASKSLRELDRDVVLVFVTNMSQFAVGGYEVGAFDFILKPVTYHSFFLKFSRIMQKIRNSDDIHIVIKGKEVTKRVSSSDIKYVEIVNHVLTYHLSSGNIVSTGTMKSVLEQLKGGSFALCNQSYLVNMKYISEFSDNEVCVGEDKLPISRPKKKEFHRAINLYFNGREVK